MVVNFAYSLQKALQEIKVQDSYSFLVQDAEIKRSLQNSDELLEKYQQAKWQLVDLLNSLEIEEFSVNLHNWLNGDFSDAVAYFLNEAGSNSLFHSEFKIPAKFHLWLGEEGFILGIEQLGKGFDAERVLQNNLQDNVQDSITDNVQDNREAILSIHKRNGGLGFSFFKNCQNFIFFDNPKEARVIFMQGKFKK